MTLCADDVVSALRLVKTAHSAVALAERFNWNPRVVAQLLRVAEKDGRVSRSIHGGVKFYRFLRLTGRLA